jgi:hypothetical protein
MRGAPWIVMTLAGVKDPNAISHRDALENRAVLGVVLVFCLVEAAWSWSAVLRHSWVPREPVSSPFGLIHILAYAFSSFVAASLAYRSSSASGRVVFGAIAGGFSLFGVEAAARLPPAGILAASVAHSLLWSAAGLIGLVLFLRRARHWNG